MQLATLSTLIATVADALRLALLLRGPSLLLPFGEQGGTTAADISGSGRHAAYPAGIGYGQQVGSQPAIATAPVGIPIAMSQQINAVFDGNRGSLVLLVEAPSLTGAEEWLDLVQFVGIPRRVALMLGQGPDGSATIQAQRNVGAGQPVEVASGPIPPNTPTSVALTWGGGTLRLYVNGVEVDSAVDTGVWPANGLIAAQCYAGGCSAPIKLAALTLYTYALSAEDIAAIHAAAGLPA